MNILPYLLEVCRIVAPMTAPLQSYHMVCHPIGEPEQVVIRPVPTIEELDRHMVLSPEAYDKLRP